MRPDAAGDRGHNNSSMAEGEYAIRSESGTERSIVLQARSMGSGRRGVAETNEHDRLENSIGVALMATVEDKDVKLLLVELAGKVDLLSSEVRNQMKLVEQKMESSTRETKQLVEFINNRIHVNEKKIEEHDKRFVNITHEWDRKIGELSMEKGRDHEQMESAIDGLLTFRTQAKTLIGLIVLLMPLITAVILKALNVK